MALTVDEAIARVPQWADADDLKISSLDGGITNSNFRVDTGRRIVCLADCWYRHRNAWH